MSGTVRDERDQIFIISVWPLSFLAVHYLTDMLYQFNVFPLIVPPYIILFACSAFIKDCDKCFTMVTHIEPVPYVFPLSIDRYRFASQSRPNDRGNQLLVVLMTPIIVRAVGDDNIHSIRVVVVSNDHVTVRFRGRVGRVGCIGCRL